MVNSAAVVHSQIGSEAGAQQGGADGAPACPMPTCATISASAMGSARRWPVPGLEAIEQQRSGDDDERVGEDPNTRP